MTRYAVTRALSSQTFHRRIKCVHTSGIGYGRLRRERPSSVEGGFPRLEPGDDVAQVLRVNGSGRGRPSRGPAFRVSDVGTAANSGRSDRLSPMAQQ